MMGRGRVSFNIKRSEPHQQHLTTHEKSPKFTSLSYPENSVDRKFPAIAKDFRPGELPEFRLFSNTEPALLPIHRNITTPTPAALLKNIRREETLEDFEHAWKEWKQSACFRTYSRWKLFPYCFTWLSGSLDVEVHLGFNGWDRCHFLWRIGIMKLSKVGARTFVRVMKSHSWTFLIWCRQPGFKF